MSPIPSDIYDLDERNDAHLEAYIDARAMVYKSPADGLRKMEELAKNGSIMSVLYVADALRKGRIYKQDLSAAEKWYQVAVEWESKRGLCGLAIVHGLQGRYQESIAEFEKAIELDYPPALNMLAYVYYLGRGVAVDRVLAEKFWIKGIKMGHLISKRNLSFMYMKGEYGVLKIFSGLVLWVGGVIDMVKIANNSIYTDRLR